MSRSLVGLLISFVLSVITINTASAAEQSIPIAKQLAAQPVALVNGDHCEIRGAVWAGGPRAGVNVELVDSAGAITHAKTGANGIYAASVPFGHRRKSLQERIADKVWVARDDQPKTHVFQPQIVCDRKATANFLSSNLGAN